MLIDTHAHLSYPDFGDELQSIIDRARAAGVERIVSISTTLTDSRKTLELAGQSDAIWATVGLHPGEIPNVSLSDMKELAALASEPKVVAIGETGLDYYRLPGRRGSSRAASEIGSPGGSPSTNETEVIKQQQKDLFWAHLELAKERRLPVVIHNRAAEADILEILRVHGESLPKDWRPWGVMHCFSGDEKFAFDCIELGLLIGFTGILTFKNSAPLRDIARKVSLDYVVVETDAPYLAPVPHRGKRNEPAYVRHVGETLAQTKGVALEEVARATTENAQRLFRFNHPPQ
jgi:TatD DNase family protein